MLRFLTAGESHGQALVAILDGLPAGLAIAREAIDCQLRRRQRGHGRGRRMAIESDRVEILSGVRHGRTLGGPIALLVRNRDWENWQATMAVDAEPSDAADRPERPPITRPRPGHADLAGALKYGHDDLRDVVERASARETAARVAVGACARQFLAHFGVAIVSHVTSVGHARFDSPAPVPFDAVATAAEDDPVRCVDPALSSRIMVAIDEAKAAGDTLGGTFEVIVRGLPPGLGSYTHWDRRLDGRLAQAIMSIPAIKAVEIGDGVSAASRRGSSVHDAILPGTGGAGGAEWHVVRPTNRAGGLEGGVTNGEEVRLTAYMKPIATLMKPLPSVDLTTGSASPATIERSDTCAVPAAAVIGEAVVALVLADAFIEKFGGDSMRDAERHYRAWCREAGRVVAPVDPAEPPTEDRRPR